MVKKSKERNNKKMGNEKACAILSYLFIGIIWYFVDENIRGNKFAKFHAKQGLVLLIISLIASALSPIVIIGAVLQIFVIVLLIIGIINAANDEEKELPLVGGLGEKFNF